MRSCATIFILLLIISMSSAHADTYSWTDEQGTVNFSEDLGSVPKQYRKKARKVLADAPRSEEKPDGESTAGKAPKATSASTEGNGWSSDAKYDGKTYAQWVQDLRNGEEAMAAVRKEIDAIDTQLQGGTTKRKELLEQRAALLTQFKQMKADYDRVIDSARRAGLQVNVEK